MTKSFGMLGLRKNVNMCILMSLKDKAFQDINNTWLKNLQSDNSNENECVQQ